MKMLLLIKYSLSVQGVIIHMEWLVLVQMYCYSVREARSFNFLLLWGLTSIKKFRYHYRQNLSLVDCQRRLQN